MNYLKKYESFFSGGMPKEITSQQWEDLEIIEYDQFGGILKNTPIPRYLFEEIVSICGAEEYLPLRQHGTIQMIGIKPNTKSLYVLWFEKEDDHPYYLIRFSTDDTIPERLQRQEGLIKYYVADYFEQVKNFSREYML